MATEPNQRMLQYLTVLEKVCGNEGILQLSHNSPEWTNALNDCISLAKKVARQAQTAWILEQDDWGRFMDAICSESKAPEMLSEIICLLSVSLRSETVLTKVSTSAEFDDCLKVLAQLAGSIENDHKSGVHLGEVLWKELRLIVKQNEWVALQVLNSTPRPECQPATPTDKEKLLSMPLKEKRKLYACKKKFVTLSDIPSWQAYALRKGLVVREDPLYPVHGTMNEKISLFVGDITTLEIDAIVNSGLIIGGGVNGAIHRAAGPALEKECRVLNRVELGEAKISGGYLLPAKYVIHTVGPVGDNAIMLQSSYRHCLALLLEHGLKTIAFPCISTRTYCNSNQKAAVVALKTVREFLQDEENLQRVDRIIFCVHVPEDTSIYKELLPVYFPT